MSSHPRNTIVAIGQVRMHWTIEENMASILDAIHLASNNGAAVCVFPELAITGFHRQIVTLAKEDLIAAELKKLQAICGERSISVAVGAPTFDGDGGCFNSCLLIDERGALCATVSKIGLTPPEATFFRPGVNRTIGTLCGLRCTAVICREIEDQAQVCAQLLPNSVDVVLWPGQMRPDPDIPVADPPDHVRQAQQLATALKAFVIQSNWPNALNRPEESEHTGKSAVISPDGELLFRLPEQASGVAVFVLGGRTYQWHPSDA
jgi:omega-amidase